MLCVDDGEFSLTICFLLYIFLHGWVSNGSPKRYLWLLIPDSDLIESGVISDSIELLSGHIVLKYLSNLLLAVLSDATKAFQISFCLFHCCTLNAMVCFPIIWVIAAAAANTWLFQGQKTNCRGCLSVVIAPCFSVWQIPLTRIFHMTFIQSWDACHCNHSHNHKAANRWMLWSWPSPVNIKLAMDAF